MGNHLLQTGIPYLWNHPPTSKLSRHAGVWNESLCMIFD